MVHRDKKVIISSCLLLLFATFGIYSGVLDNQFLTEWDDGIYITNNVFIQTGISKANLLSASSASVGMNWHPVTMFSHMLDVQLFGLQPLWHHLVNLLFHCTNTLLVYAFFKRTTKQQTASIFAALIFGIHPLHVESVAWVAERKDVLSSFFVLTAMNIYINFVSASRGIKLYQFVAIMVLFAMGLMSKSMVITFPILLLILDYWPLERFSKDTINKIILEKVPLLLLSVVFIGITLTTQKTDIFKFGDRIVNAIYGLEMYAFKFVVPFKLCYFYDFQEKYTVSTLLSYLFVFAVIAIVLFIAVRKSKQSNVLIAGMLWFLVSIAPVSGIVSFGYQSHADRYMYMPILGFIMLVCFYLSSNFRWIFPLLPLFILFWSYNTYSYEKNWNNEFNLYSNKYRYDPNNIKNNFKLGNYYLDKNIYLSTVYFNKVISAASASESSTDTKYIKESAFGLAIACTINKQYTDALISLSSFFGYQLDLDPQYARAFDLLHETYGGLNQHDKANQAEELGRLYKNVLQTKNGEHLQVIRQRLKGLL